MPHLRVALRLVVFLGATLAGHAALLAVRPLSRLAPARRLRLRNAIFRAWGRTLCRSTGMRLRVAGRAPDGACLVVANHLSYMDVPLLGSQLDAAFVAKAELARWPAVGRAFGAADTIFIDRSRKRDLLRVLERIEATLAAGLKVVIFPEGTSGDGTDLLPFRPSLLELASRHGHPVHYATLSYRTPVGAPPARQVVCWWGAAPFLPHLLRLLRLRGFEATLCFGAEPIAAPDRKALAHRLRQAMLGRFTAVR